MTRSLLSLLLLFGLAIPLHAQFGARANIQHPHRNEDSPFSIGGYASLGGQSSTPPGTGGNGLGIVGLYAELNRGFLHPGLDLRGTVTGGYGPGGTLVGPRLAFSYNFLHPYVEGLIGPNHSIRSNADIEGITTQFVAGLDLETGPNLRFRLVEFSQSHFSGVAGANPYAITTGIVIHIP